MAYHSLCVYLIPLYSSSLPEIGRVRHMIIIEPRRSICSRVSQTKIDILKSCEIQWNPESFNRFQSFSIVINHVQSFRARGDSASGSLDYLIDARQRLAVANVEIIPSGGAQFVRLLMSSELGIRGFANSENSVSLQNLAPRLGEWLLNYSLQNSPLIFMLLLCFLFVGNGWK